MSNRLTDTTFKFDLRPDRIQEGCLVTSWAQPTFWLEHGASFVACMRWWIWAGSALQPNTLSSCSWLYFFYKLLILLQEQQRWEFSISMTPCTFKVITFCLFVCNFHVVIHWPHTFYSAAFEIFMPSTLLGKLNKERMQPSFLLACLSMKQPYSSNYKPHLSTAVTHRLAVTSPRLSDLCCHARKISQLTASALDTVWHDPYRGFKDRRSVLIKAKNRTRLFDCFVQVRINTSKSYKKRVR